MCIGHPRSPNSGRRLSSVEFDCTVCRITFPNARALHAHLFDVHISSDEDEGGSEARGVDADSVSQEDEDDDGGDEDVGMDGVV